MNFNIERDSIPHEEQKKYSMSLLDKGLIDFIIQKKRTNIKKLIYKYNTEGMSPKDFSNYQNLIDLFKN